MLELLMERNYSFRYVAKQRMISYMPRKNPKDSAVVAALLKQQSWFRQFGWSLQSINGLSQAEVAE